VPAYNEAENLESTLNELKSSVPFDILVVDDGSKDETSLVSKQNRVAVIRLPFNLGIGGAVQTGFQYAVQKGYDVAVQVDADGQHVASSVSAMVNFLIAGKADIVIGSRYLGGYNTRTSLIREMGIRYFSWLTSKVVGYRVTDCTSGFRAINRRALDYFSEFYPIDFPDAEALILAHRSQLRVAEFPVHFRERVRGKSSLRTFRFVYYPIKETFSILMLITKR
jgi:glycosyltransferase involved in cell wall biosynthesis